MRLFRAFLLVCTAFLLPQCCQLPARSIDQRASFVDNLVQKTVSLEAFYNGDDQEVDPNEDGAEMHIYCAGTWISSTEILTAYHCIADRQGPHSPPPQPAMDNDIEQLLGQAVEQPNDPTDALVYYSQRGDISDIPGHEKKAFWKAKVERFDLEHDLALLYVMPNEDYPAHDIASLGHSVEVGEKLHIIGFPAGALWAYQQGYVSTWRNVDSRDDKIEVRMMQVQAPIYYGNSGGPTFNDAGQLLGVCSRRSTQVPDLGLFVSLYDIRAFLQ